MTRRWGFFAARTGLALLVAACAGGGGGLRGMQTEARFSPTPNAIAIAYRFADFDGVPHSVTLTLPRAAAEAAQTEWAPFDGAAALLAHDRALAAALAPALADLQPRFPGAEIGGIAQGEVAFSAPPAQADAVRRAISMAVAEATEAGLAAADAEIAAQGYLRFGGDQIVPDYARAARGPALAGLAGEMAPLIAGLDDRAALNRLLAFFQGLPYDPLTDRSQAGTAAGFAPPLALFAQHRGDCDSKSVALAGLLRHLRPQIASALILLPDHALLALDVAPREGDRTIAIDGRPWLLADPVGPMAAPAGRVTPISNRGLAGERFVFRLFGGNSS